MSTIQDAVQPPEWYRALPRSGWAEFEKIDSDEGWFDVYRLPNETYAIYEPGHFQEVISYLIVGAARALLLDTGMGIGDIASVVRVLTDLPIVVVNSHCHFDHIGANAAFGSVYIYNHPAALTRLRSGMTSDRIVHHLAGDSTARPYPAGFDPSAWTIAPCRPIPIEDGHRFDLGGRVLEVIHTPGHTPDSIMLFDRDARVLFTGDTYYPATLYAHMSSPEGVDSSFPQYWRTMRRLAGVDGVDTLYTSHNEPAVPASVLGDVADGFDRIAVGDARYDLDEKGLRKYSFDGFAVVTLDPPVPDDPDKSGDSSAR